jgi:DinB superfamily
MNIESLKKGFLKSTDRIAAACEGITKEEGNFRPYDKANSLVWEIGHLNFYRNTVIKLLNPTEVIESMPNEKETFGFGSKPTDNYPEITDILTAIRTRGERIAELLGVVTEEHLAAESPMNIPNLGKTVGQQVFSFFIHEANHYGEISYIKTLIHRLR